VTDVAGRHVVVVGCTSGIGRALALELGRAGAVLSLFGRREEPLRALAAELAAAGVEAAVYPGDTRDAERVGAVCGELARHPAGPPFGLAFAAGVSHATLARALTTDEARAVMETNYFGALHWLEALLPGLLDRRAGFVLGVTALCADRGVPSAGVYAASKGALSRLLDGLRLDLEPRGIRVFEVLPGFVDTPMSRLNTHVSMPLMVSAERAARTIARGLRRDRTRIEVPWTHGWLFRLVRPLPNALYALLFRSYVRGRDHLEHALAALPPLVCPDHGEAFAFDRYGSWICPRCDHRIRSVRDRFRVLDGAPEAPAGGPGLGARLVGPLRAFAGARRRAGAFLAERLRAAPDPVVAVGAADGDLLRLALRRAAWPAERPLLAVHAARGEALRADARLRPWRRAVHLARPADALDLAPGSVRLALVLGLRRPAEGLARLAALLAEGGELAGAVVFGAGAGRGLPPDVLRAPDEAAVERLLAGAGLALAARERAGALLLFRAGRAADAAAPAASGGEAGEVRGCPRPEEER